MISEIDKLKHFHIEDYKGIRLEDVTVELEEEAYEEMRNNK